MEKMSLEAPFLFGDHHVTEVHRLLGALPGVTNSYVSSSFHTIEVTFDPTVTNANTITECLAEAGYLTDVSMSVETGVSDADDMNSPFFRKAAVYETTRKVTSFVQIIAASNKKVWPVPGMGVSPIKQNK